MVCSLPMKQEPSSLAMYTSLSTFECVAHMLKILRIRWVPVLQEKAKLFSLENNSSYYLRAISCVSLLQSGAKLSQLSSNVIQVLHKAAHLSTSYCTHSAQVVQREGATQVLGRMTEFLLLLGIIPLQYTCNGSSQSIQERDLICFEKYCVSDIIGASHKLSY